MITYIYLFSRCQVGRRAKRSFYCFFGTVSSHITSQVGEQRCERDNRDNSQGCKHKSSQGIKIAVKLVVEYLSWPKCQSVNQWETKCCCPWGCLGKKVCSFLKINNPLIIHLNLFTLIHPIGSTALALVFLYSHMKNEKHWSKRAFSEVTIHTWG